MSVGETIGFDPTEQLPIPVPQEKSAAQDAARDTVRQGLQENGEQNLVQVRDVITQPFDGEAPDAIFAHSGGMSFREKLGKHMTTSYAQDQLTEHGQATGGRLRVIAAAEIAKALPEVPLITNSFNRFDPEEPTMASVVMGELVQRGVDEERITQEVASFSTITQMVEMVRLAVANGWTKITALTNEFHYPRMTEMFASLDTIVDDADFQTTLADFKMLGVQVNFVSSETIIRLKDERFGAYFDRAAQSPQYQVTVAAEAQGLADLKAGKYRVVLNPERPRSE